MNRTRIFQNALRCPSGHIICSRNEKEIMEYQDPLDNEIYVVAGGCRIPFRKFPSKETDLFEDLKITEVNPIEEIKNKLVWGTYSTLNPKERTSDRFHFKKLIDLETPHLEAIASSKSLNNLHRFIIGLILQDRQDARWKQKGIKTAKIYQYKQIEEEIKL